MEYLKQGIKALLDGRFGKGGAARPCVTFVTFHNVVRVARAG